MADRVEAGEEVRIASAGGRRFEHSSDQAGQHFVLTLNWALRVQIAIRVIIDGADLDGPLPELRAACRRLKGYDAAWARSRRIIHAAARVR